MAFQSRSKLIFRIGVGDGIGFEGLEIVKILKWTKSRFFGQKYLRPKLRDNKDKKILKDFKANKSFILLPKLVRGPVGLGHWPQMPRGVRVL